MRVESRRVSGIDRIIVPLSNLLQRALESGCAPRFRGDLDSWIDQALHGKLIAVNHLDLEVPSGEVFGFLGLNGAGKTTTIRILLDLLRPNSGHAAVFGHDCQSDSLKARSAVGYLPGEMGVYSDLTGHEMLVLLERVGGGGVSREHRRSLCERFELSERDLSRKLREYSTGMKRKLGVDPGIPSRPAPADSGRTHGRSGSADAGILL